MEFFLESQHLSKVARKVVARFSFLIAAKTGRAPPPGRIVVIVPPFFFALSSAANNNNSKKTDKNKNRLAKKIG